METSEGPQQGPQGRAGTPLTGHQGPLGGTQSRGPQEPEPERMGRMKTRKVVLS